MIFGLTGGIACGKSTVSKTLMDNGIPVVDADIIARQVVEPGSYGLKAIVAAFGEDILLPDGMLDRNKFADLVFSSKPLTLLLNSIVMPLIQRKGAEECQKLQQEGHALICWDAALICETGNADKYRPLVVVSCPTQTQIERLIKRNGLTETQALRRIEAQLPTQEKVKLADFVIDTSGSLESSKEQTLQVIERIKLLLLP